mmetsp:Transcript_35125/g.44766  ORF Transcript_35125/g.44766 Transcript_35125/m.44766 type:complete len:200 (-) Transcript_35125:233-832(-)|eukprot:CAMPEP_0117737498 /NCGR_PEP_ID=MMETSP0947-20121206/2572_1 /TAXON_ID=44440 /ORGANISM="Chattonella subsalsa, Strain CCMP2191" /LENGTH=199 /DNA_ID=CAMNT_0005553013 /DNA_START=11 /DNA_END=610 /DNA_ORIENTATION=+
MGNNICPCLCDCGKNDNEQIIRDDGSNIMKAKKISKNDFEQYIEKHAELWAMLAVNLGKSEEFCREIASSVAYSMAQNIKSKNASESGKLTQSQFTSFRVNWVQNPKGQREFFQRCVFAVFDEDNNKVLDDDELSNFLDIFYEAGSIFKGDLRLPEKDKLTQWVKEKLDTDHDGKLSFEEIGSLISGTTDLSEISIGVK